MQHHRWIIAVAVTIGTGMVAVPSAGEAGAPAQPCVVSGAAGQGLDHGPRDADGLYPFQTWLTTNATRGVQQAMEQTRRTIMGIADDAPLADQLQHGLIGYAPDNAARTMVTVVTADYTAPAGLTTPGDRVQKGCFSASQLIEADSVLRQRTWHPDAAQASFAYALRGEDSKFHVTFDARYPAAADALTARLGDRVVVELGSVSRMGRLNDGEPHYGGSGIRKGFSTSLTSNTCTSGFVVRRKSDGRRGVTTANHCFSNGDSIYSSTEFAGVLWGEGTVDNPYPLYDVAGVMSSGETYANIIHVEPCSPCIRTVTAKSTIGGGSAMCLSGMVTTAICSVIVTGTGALCDNAGCTLSLIEGMRNGDTVVRGGDSGGPAYIRTGTASATAIGTIVGGATGRTGSSTVVYVEPIGSLETALGVTVAFS